MAAPSSTRAAPRAASAWPSKAKPSPRSAHSGVLELTPVSRNPADLHRTRPLQRLQQKRQFEAVLAGATVARTAHFALHRCALESGSKTTGPGSEGSQALFAVRAPWIGAMVPKRWAKRAVTRNTIKRQIYAVARDLASLPEAAHVVRLRNGFDRRQFPSATSIALKQAVRAELQALFAGARP